jgi:ribosomal protein S13
MYKNTVLERIKQIYGVGQNRASEIHKQIGLNNKRSPIIIKSGHRNKIKNFINKIIVEQALEQKQKNNKLFLKKINSFKNFKLNKKYEINKKQIKQKKIPIKKKS